MSEQINADEDFIVDPCFDHHGIEIGNPPYGTQLVRSLIPLEEIQIPHNDEEARLYPVL